MSSKYQELVRELEERENGLELDKFHDRGSKWAKEDRGSRNLLTPQAEELYSTVADIIRNNRDRAEKEGVRPGGSHPRGYIDSLDTFNSSSQDITRRPNPASAKDKLPAPMIYIDLKFGYDEDSVSYLATYKDLTTGFSPKSEPSQKIEIRKWWQDNMETIYSVFEHPTFLNPEGGESIKEELLKNEKYQKLYNAWEEHQIPWHLHLNQFISKTGGIRESIEERYESSREIAAQASDILEEIEFAEKMSDEFKVSGDG